MKLGVRETAKLLDVSEKTVYRWIAKNRMPTHRVNDQYRFNRAELLEWATSQRIAISPKMLEEPEDGPMPSLTEALRAGGIHYRLGGNDKASALRAMVDVMPLPQEVDRDFLYQVLLARESVGSTGVGEGIAIPHVRNPVVLNIPRPMVALCFLDNPVDFNAIDAKPVCTLFAIVSPSIKAHLSLLSRLAYGLRPTGGSEGETAFARAVQTRASRDELIAAAELLEKSLPQSGRGTEGAAQ